MKNRIVSYGTALVRPWTAVLLGAVLYSVAVPAAQLTGTETNTTLAYNLTAQSADDWVNWGRGGVYTNVDRKSGGGSQISGVTAIGSGQGADNLAPRYSTSWSDGTPTASASGDGGFVYTTTLNSGYSFTVPASTTLRTLRIYLGGYDTQSKLTAHLSDNSASDYVDIRNGNGAYQHFYTITYQAASSGQTLTVSYIKNQDLASGGGSVDLKAAWVSGGGTPTNQLTGTETNTTLAYNLTAQSADDWVNWGRGGVYTNVDRKSGGGNQISGLTAIGSGQGADNLAPRYSTSWSDGTPTASASGDGGFVYTTTLNSGYSFTVPASTTLRTLSIYLGGYDTQSKLTAHLSDNSSSDYVDIRNGNGAYQHFYTISYRAASSGQTLTVSYIKNQDLASGGGSVDLKAAWVSGGGTPANQPPTVSITAPTNGATYTAPASVTINATAADSDGTVSDVAFYSGPTLISHDTTSPYSTSVSGLIAGTYTLTARATDNGGLITTSAPVVITVLNPGITLHPGDDIQAAVTTNGQGTLFNLTAGTYRLQQIQPRDNDQFIGQPGAILSGARVLSLTYQSPYWVATNQTQQGQINGYGDSTHPGAIYPEDLFIDGAPLLHVTSLGQVTTGSWYFDYDADKIYMADNPSGHVVETSVARSAFSGSATNVVIRGLVVEKYAIPAQFGAIGDQYPGSGWVIQGNEIRWNHGAGVNLADKAYLSDNFIHHNGEMGVGGHGVSLVVSNNEISFNNWAGYDITWEGGGTKFAVTTNLLVIRNFSHDNNGLGLWTDVENYGAIYDSNVVSNNPAGGLQHEISYQATIRNNSFLYNGAEGCAWVFGAQIQIVNSPNVEIYGNSLVLGNTGCQNGIVLMTETNRGTGPHGLYIVTNAWVHNNTITQLGSGLNGAVTDDSIPSHNIFAPAFSNRFDYNTYYVTNTSGYYWAWSNAPRSWLEFTSYGQEPHGAVH